MLINISNHPSSKWSKQQLDAANEYGGVVDLQFPHVAASEDEEYIASLTNEYVQKITRLYENRISAIHIMGEMTFSFALIQKLKAQGFECIASTSARCVNEMANGKKEVKFEFVRFRKY